MQRAELEELRQREANLTALQAIGTRKKARLDLPGGSGDSITNGSTHSVSTGSVRIVYTALIHHNWLRYQLSHIPSVVEDKLRI